MAPSPARLSSSLWRCEPTSIVVCVRHRDIGNAAEVNRRRANRRLIAALGLMTWVIAGCGAATGPTPDPDSSGSVVHAVPAGLPRPAHVLVVIFENKSSSEVVGNRSAPYLTGLADHGAYFVRAHSVAHPSEPNYLALFSGSTQGLTSDACPLHFGRRSNLAAELSAAGSTFVGYAEGLPRPSYAGCSSGEYARKHAPWTDFAGLPAGTAQPLSAFPHELSKLPTVAFVVPNLCHDMHDCSVSARRPLGAPAPEPVRQVGANSSTPAHRHLRRG
jgi:acid phosphatase